MKVTVASAKTSFITLPRSKDVCRDGAGARSNPDCDFVPIVVNIFVQCCLHASFTCIVYT